MVSGLAVLILSFVGIVESCLISNYYEYNFYHKYDDKFKDYTFKEYLKERGIFHIDIIRKD